MSPPSPPKSLIPPLLGENRIVDLIRRRFAVKDRRVRKGIGDDAAVIRIPGASEDWVLTTDMLVEAVDFLPDWQSPSQLGWKSLAVSLSDLAAMGARPRYYMVSLALPREIRMRWISSFYQGMVQVGDAAGAVLIGGDLSHSPKGIHVSITGIGETIKRRCLCRSGGRAGDLIYATGVLGLSAAGLALLQSGVRKGKTTAEKQALETFRRPKPRCDAGLWLARSGCASAMMDLSDGLSTDLGRLCRASRCGALIYADRIPIFSAAAAWKCHPLSLALHGGEDFELLFCVPARQAVSFEQKWPSGYPRLSCIGKLTSTAGVLEIRNEEGKTAPLQPEGYDHFHPTFFATFFD